jgi:hypothetical protein
VVVSCRVEPVIWVEESDGFLSNDPPPGQCSSALTEIATGHAALLNWMLLLEQMRSIIPAKDNDACLARELAGRSQFQGTQGEEQCVATPVGVCRSTAPIDRRDVVA